jgi:hypothetical protein
MAEIPWDELMDAASTSDFAPIPQSDYDVKIIETEATKSSTDKPMWKITTAVLNGPHEGRKVWTQTTLSVDNPDALAVFFRQMAAVGLTKEFFATKPSNQEIADALLGRQFRAKVTIREWQGTARNNIKNWNPIGAASRGPGGVSAPPGVGGPPPPPSGATPPPAAAAPPPAAAAPPPAAAAPPPPPAPPAPAESAAEPAPVTASAGPPGAPGTAGSWVVEERKTGSTEAPPF